MKEPRVVTDPGELTELFRLDTASHIYALADLAEPYWSRSTWWRRDDAAVGLVGLDERTSLIYSVSTADPQGTLALLREVQHEIPPCLVTGPVGLGDTLRRAGQVLKWNRQYNRFHLPDSELTPPPKPHVVDLGPEDAPEACELYNTQPDAAFFLPAMLDDASFVGVRESGKLIAIAGTHVVTEAHRAAAIGAVFVHPEHRGRGLGRDVTAGVLARLADRCETIGLNCTEHNTSARRTYSSLGFVEGLRYEECELAG